MEISKEQAIKDLEIESASPEIQDQIVQAFFNGLQNKIKSAIITDESIDKDKFINADEETQDNMIEQAAGGNLDETMDRLYKESVEEFLENSKKLAERIKTKNSDKF